MFEHMEANRHLGNIVVTSYPSIRSSRLVLLAVVSDCDDDTGQANQRVRRRALFRGATLAFRPALVRRLHGADLLVSPAPMNASSTRNSTTTRHAASASCRMTVLSY